jgi:hypothetical protein
MTTINAHHHVYALTHILRHLKWPPSRRFTHLILSNLAPYKAITAPRSTQMHHEINKLFPEDLKHSLVVTDGDNIPSDYNLVVGYKSFFKIIFNFLLSDNPSTQIKVTYNGEIILDHDLFRTACQSSTEVKACIDNIINGNDATKRSDKHFWWDDTVNESSLKALINRVTTDTVTSQQPAQMKAFTFNFVYHTLTTLMAMNKDEPDKVSAIYAFEEMLQLVSREGLKEALAIKTQCQHASNMLRKVFFIKEKWQIMADYKFHAETNSVNRMLDILQTKSIPLENPKNWIGKGLGVYRLEKINLRDPNGEFKNMFLVSLSSPSCISPCSFGKNEKSSLSNHLLKSCIHYTPYRCYNNIN